MYLALAIVRIECPEIARIKIELRRIATGVSYKGDKSICIESVRSGKY